MPWSPCIHGLEIFAQIMKLAIGDGPEEWCTQVMQASDTSVIRCTKISQYAFQVSNNMDYWMRLYIFHEELSPTRGDGTDTEDDNRISGMVIE